MSFSTTAPRNAPKATPNITLCYYTNPSPEVQVLRIQEAQDFYFEKVVFPQERLFFSAPRSSLLQVFNQSEGALCLRTIPCAQIQVSS